MTEQAKIEKEFERVLALEAKAITECAQKFKDNQFKEIHVAVRVFLETLNKGGKIVVTGVGKSGKVAQKIAATLSSTGSLAVFLHPTDGLHGDLGVVRPGDALLALSYSGNTDELIGLLPSLLNIGIPMIGLGGNADSQLAQSCDAWIDASVSQEACPHNLAPTTSSTVMLAIGDALAMTLMQLRGFDMNSFAQNHPGGSLGRRLQLRVSDLMHAQDSLGVVAEDTPIEDVIIQSTEAKLGGVIVAQGSKLVGLITDGDLRRALSHKEAFFKLKARDVMTANPTTARPEMKAIDALRIMENRPSQISVLPVVDDSHHWKGLLRLHDIVKSL